MNRHRFLYLRDADSSPRESPIYLDWNSTSPMSANVVSRMRWAAERFWANPSSVHSLGRLSKGLVESARSEIAESVGAQPERIVFTSGGTEANNWALADAPGLVLSKLEHPSVARQAERLVELNRPVRWLPVHPNGKVDVCALGPCLAELPEGSRVAVMAVNHETGVIQPLDDIAAIAHEFGAWVHVDAVQALGKLPTSLWQTWDTLTLGAHKIRGPKAIGALAWRCGVPLPRQLMWGGSQERGLRPGTVDPVLIAGFSEALQSVHDGPLTNQRLGPLRNRFEAGLRQWAEPNIVDDASRLGHVSSLFFRGWSAAELVAAMDLEGVCISSGSACAAGTTEISPVITAMFGVDRARSTVRVSLGETTTGDDVERALRAFHAVLSRL